jgi:SAM-dependent methyltransferase
MLGNSAMISFDHSRNRQTLQGAKAVLSAVFCREVPRSLLDVGCGTGTWLRAAADLGTNYVFGLDGILAKEQLHIPRHNIEELDLTVPFDLGRRFELVLCLEVAEHLPKNSASTLISSIVRHSDLVLFSAACPRQPGQNHINCQWPAYWQAHFNRCGFMCDDSVRWQIWEDQRIEPWYRQNIFYARHDPYRAGREMRLKPVIHPELFESLSDDFIRDAVVNDIGKGSMGWTWYLTLPLRAASGKLRRRASLSIGSDNKRDCRSCTKSDR